VNKAHLEERQPKICLTLARQGNPLAEPINQVRVLAPKSRQKPFETALTESGLFPLQAVGIQVLQVNVGKLCNQTCRHCHVDAGPDRREVMTRETMLDCLDALARTGIPTLDITGGAPEMNPHFRWFVSEARYLGRHVIDRCNLTILLAPGYQDLPEFLASQRVEIVASLPCYLPENTDAQRGPGVFDRSITALERLNAVGYGQIDSGLVLSLVYNPIGPSLPPPQAGLEAAFHHQLKARHEVVFNRLYAITNMPISRFLDDLLNRGQYDQYMEKLIEAYNPAAAEGVMCRTTLSVGWDGQLYDCDFNQMLELHISPGLAQHIRNLDTTQLMHRPIVTGQHCYGCTAGCGSSCQGAVLA
jgi:radical SAM/Cys-rich protein